MSFEETKLKNDIRRLEDDLETLEFGLYGYGSPGYNMNKYKTGTSRYEEAKKEFDKRFPKYQSKKKELERQLSTLKVKLDNVSAEKEKEKESKDAKEEVAKAKDDLQRAKDSRNPEAQKAAEEALRAARIKRNQAGVVDTEKDADAAEVSIEEDKFSGYTVGDGIVTNKDGRQVYFVDVPDGKGNMVPNEFISKAKAREAFLKNYATTDKLSRLQAELLAANYIKQSDIVKGTWIDGLDDMLIARSAKVVSDVQYGLGKPISAEDFLKIKKDSGTGGAKVYRDLSTRGDARQQINDYLMDLTGSAATEEEYEEYYKLLNAEEKRQTMTSANGTTTGDVMTDAERLVIAAKVARNRLKNTDVDALLSSSKGSRVSMDIAALQELAADYGIEMSAADALRQVTQGIGQKDYLQKQQERLRLIAKKMHPGLADHLDAGGTVAEIANVYARTKFNKLGIVVKTATKDKDVMDAVAAGKPIAQFEKELQANPMWRFTDEARETASDFLTTIGRMWGRG